MDRTIVEHPPTPALFRLYTLDELARLSPYTEAYLVDLKRRPERIRPQFRRVMSRVLGFPEEELFGTRIPLNPDDRPDPASVMTFAPAKED